MKSILDSESPEDSEVNNAEVLTDQLHLLSKQNHGQRYDAAMIKAAITLYLHGRDFNQVLQKYLHLPHPNTIKSYFGTLNTSGSLSDCQKKLLMSLTNSLKNKNIAKSLPMKFT